MTILVVLASVFLGLWLDSTFNTKPMFTLILLFAGIPLSVVLMLFVSRRTLARMQEKNDTKEKE